MSSSKKSKQQQKQKRKLKRAKKHREARKRKRYEPLMKKLEQQGLAQDMKFMYEPKGEIKMSEVLNQFVEPYLEEARTKQDYEKLLMLAIMAWNTALLPEDTREEKLEKILVESVSPIPKEIKGFIYALIERKERYFHQYKRGILNFELSDTGHDYHLSVISTL